MQKNLEVVIFGYQQAYGECRLIVFMQSIEK